MMTNEASKAAKAYRDKLSAEQRGTRQSPALTLEQIHEGMIPIIATCMTTYMNTFMDVYKQASDIVKNRDQDKIDEKLNVDRQEVHNRRDNVIIFAYEEPPNNYLPNGRETQEQLEDILIDVGNKAGVKIERNYISDGFRMGKRPVNENGSPKTRHDGTKVARPIHFRLNKGFAKTALLRNKKMLKETHGIKIAEDTTPLRKALCDFANEIESVKVAYPQGGKIFVRTKENPSRVIQLETYKDLDNVPGFSGELNYQKLKLRDGAA